MRNCFLAALMALFMANATAETKETSIDVTFPDRLGPLEFQRKQEIQPKELGIALQYASPTRDVWATIYIYDLGLKEIPTDLADHLVMRVFLQTLQDAKQQVVTGRVREVRISDEPPKLARTGLCGREYLRTDFEIDTNQGSMKSYAVLTTLRGNFVKLRISHPRDQEQSSAQVVSFIEAVSLLLGGCIQNAK